MNSLAIVEALPDPDTLYRPSGGVSIGEIVQAHAIKLAKLVQVAERVSGEEFADVLPYFFRGNAPDGRTPSLNVRSLFTLDPAVRMLERESWQACVEASGIWQLWPQKRRTAWVEMLDEGGFPAFTHATIKETLGEHLAQRHRYFAERIDGVFRALSGEHLTNRPEGFFKRMIFAGVTSIYCSQDRIGHIEDLRRVLAIFMNRPEPQFRSTSIIVEAAMNRWIDVDGGAFRMKIYGGVGTAHIEIHPDMAWRMNQFLHILYPRAIPEVHRRRPAKRTKSWVAMQRPLPSPVIELLAKASLGRTSVHIIPHDEDRHVRNEVAWVMEYLGGVRDETSIMCWSFDYRPDDAIRLVVSSGCLPDIRTHQYYPTPPAVADQAVRLAQIDSHHLVLEPSAGTGSIAVYLPKDRTTCVEISRLHAQILRSKGLRVIHGDFLEAAKELGRFDRIVMNPPFSDGRHEAHLRAAVDLLSPGGVLVAVLPASQAGSNIAGLSCSWSAPIEGAFAGTSMAVTLLRGVKDDGQA